jgi:hypothetical protein
MLCGGCEGEPVQVDPENINHGVITACIPEMGVCAFSFAVFGVYFCPAGRGGFHEAFVADALPGRP